MQAEHAFTVACELGFEVTSPNCHLALQVAPSLSAGARDTEQLWAALDGALLELAVVEPVTAPSGELTVLEATSGHLLLGYRATLRRPAEPRESTTPVPLTEVMAALRPSRFCPSDQLAGFATREFGAPASDPGLPAAVATWVFEHVGYDPTATHPSGSAVDTLGTGAGVCRDFAHLTIALCRALDIPARLVAAYAPGLSPMDFHAVAEVLVEGRWQIFDASRMAPRSTLVRIATGRDAADTAFATTLAGRASLTTVWVSAVVDGALPADDHQGVVVLP